MFLTSKSEALLAWLDAHIQGYEEVVSDETSRPEGSIRRRTYAQKHFAPVLGQSKLCDLTPRKLQEFYNFKQKSEGLSPKTVINMNLCLHKALNQAVSEGL